MPILRRTVAVQLPASKVSPVGQNLRPSAQPVKQADTYRDACERDGVSQGARDVIRAKLAAPEDVRNLDQRMAELIKQHLPSGFALVKVEVDSEFKHTSHSAGQNEMFRLVRQAMTTLRELNSHPGVGVMWRINWILAELADFGVHLRWTSPHVPFLDLP